MNLVCRNIIERRHSFISILLTTILDHTDREWGKAVGCNSNFKTALRHVFTGSWWWPQNWGPLRWCRLLLTKNSALGGISESFLESFELRENIGLTAGMQTTIHNEDKPRYTWLILGSSKMGSCFLQRRILYRTQASLFVADRKVIFKNLLPSRGYSVHFCHHMVYWNWVFCNSSWKMLKETGRLWPLCLDLSTLS